MSIHAKRLLGALMAIVVVGIVVASFLLLSGDDDDPNPASLDTSGEAGTTDQSSTSMADTAEPTTSPDDADPSNSATERQDGTPSATGDPILAADGLGVATFGDPASEVLAALTDRFGPPDSDTGLVKPSKEQVLGACPPGRQRAVRWGQLTVGLLEGSSGYSTRKAEHLVMYRYGNASPPGKAGPLSTAEGVSVGSSVDEVRQAYGSSAEVIAGDELVEPSVRLDLDAQHPLVMQTVKESVSSIRAGEPCS